MHKVDIVVPTYNYGRFLGACLESVLAQTWGDFQVLVIDNASTDNTEDLMQEWLKLDSRIKYERNPVNIGVAGSVRKAHKMTSAPYWMTLCSDDLLLPDFLRKIVFEGLERHDECGFGYGLHHRLTDRGLVPDMFMYVPKLETGVRDVLDHLCITNWILMSFGVARRRCLDELRVHERHDRKFYENSPRRGSLGDHLQWMLIASRYPAYVVNERLSIYREHGESDTTAQGYVTLREETLVLYDAVFYLSDVFDLETRYLARINQVGRLLTSYGLASTAISMARSGEIGPVVADSMKSILQRLVKVLREFYFDDSSGRMSNLTFELEKNLDTLAEISSKL